MKALLLSVLLVALCIFAAFALADDEPGGIHLTKEQAMLCHLQGCATHTGQQLKDWYEKVRQDGYNDGYKAGYANICYRPT